MRDMEFIVNDGEAFVHEEKRDRLAVGISAERANEQGVGESN